ncbi:MAG: glycosyl hydrolase [Gemmatimonadota bacterium]|nr:MAG: glycosyl hydrolase [Gemmatimonadota bacterium]
MRVIRNVAAVLGTAAFLLPQGAAAQVTLDPAAFGGLEARPIGPAVMSGRISAIDAWPESPVTIWVGTASGGVWKSRDGGVTFQSVFDDHTQSIGAVTIDPTDQNTVWVGTGETWTRNSVSVGTGVYRTTDGGDNWEFMGLGDSERIARIQVSPADGNVVYVCATGHLWDGNEERGVYKTTDGGETWERILYVDEGTGCADLAMDPQDPDILYAAMWEFRRAPDFFNSGGPGSGLHKSSDGGATWKELTSGLPAGTKGRIAVAIAPSRPNVLYATVEAEKTAMYRSDDTGEHWREVNASNSVRQRPFYFSLVVVDPTDFNRVYKPGLSLAVSDDGGNAFSSFLGGGGGSYHGDLHALWINPSDPHHLILGTDGGVYISHDRGNRWRHVKSLPVSQFYEVAYDMEIPYNVYGGLQDNGSWTGPSRSVAGIQNKDWRNIGFGDGFHAVPDPNDEDIVYVEYQGGMFMRFRKSTGEIKDIRPYPRAGDPKLRFNWNAPMHVGPSGALYVGSQHLHRSTDQGDSWERLSPDLTTNDPARQRQAQTGGLTIDNTTAENNTTVYTISESPHDAQVIWVGTDDGNVQVTRDGGQSWANVLGNMPGAPSGSWVSHVEAGLHAPGTAFVTFDGHRSGDMRTHVYRTTDYGQTWESLVTEDIEGYAFVIREDLSNPDLLFLGTEFGLYVSLDAGASWARFESGLPKMVSVHDLRVHPREHDLIIATHGRGIYILDDITPLRHLTQAMLDSAVVMLPTRPAELRILASVQDFPGDEEFVGRNPPDAANIVYYLKRRHMFGDLMVEVYDQEGNLVNTAPGGKRRGLNRVPFPTRMKPPKVPPAGSLVQSPGAFTGPRLPEGTYTVRLIKGNDTYESSVTLVPDPRSTATPEDRLTQYQTALRLYRMVGRLGYVVDALVDLRDQARARAEALGRGRTTDRLNQYADRLEAFRAEIVSTSDAGMWSGEEFLRERLVDLYGAVNAYEGRPTDSQLERVDVLEAQLVQAEQRFAQLIERDFENLNRQLERSQQEPLTLLTKEAWESQ